MGGTMKKIMVYDRQYAKVYYLPEMKTIEVLWEGNHTVEEYKAAINAALKFQADTGVPVYSYVSDIRLQGVVNPESRRWFEQEAIPQAISQGLKRAAAVLDRNVFRRYYINLIIQIANVNGLPMKVFGSIQEAYDWILSFGNEDSLAG